MPALSDAPDITRLSFWAQPPHVRDEVFTRLRTSRQGATSEEVAQVIFEAATDGTKRLRYVATDDIKPWVAARRETSEAAYMAFMQAQVGPRLG